MTTITLNPDQFAAVARAVGLPGAPPIIIDALAAYLTARQKTAEDTLGLAVDLHQDAAILDAFARTLRRHGVPVDGQGASNRRSPDRHTPRGRLVHTAIRAAPTADSAAPIVTELADALDPKDPDQ